MKTLFFMRHAKSSWADEGGDDHARPLNERGERTAPVMAKLLLEQGPAPHAILSSTALRARQTAFAVAEALAWAAETTLSRRLYLAEPKQILARIAETPDAVGCLLVVGHNPGMEDLVSDLANRREHMPTAAIAKFSVEAKSWAHVARAPAELVQLWRPKELD